MSKNRLDEAAEQEDQEPDTAESPTISKTKQARGIPAQDIGKQIADGISEGMARMAPQRIKPGSPKYDPRSPFQAREGFTRLQGTVYYQGIQLYEHQLTNEEIRLYNQITVGGRYINRLVEVVVSTDAGTRVVLIKFPDRTLDQRMENKNHWRNQQELLELIVREQKKVVAA